MTPTDVTFTVSCSNVEAKALLYAMVDIGQWLQTTLTARAYVAIQDVVKEEVARMLADPSVTNITADKFDIVMNCSRPTLKDETDRVPQPAPDQVVPDTIPPIDGTKGDTA
jgi:hypothetical protein